MHKVELNYLVKENNDKENAVLLEVRLTNFSNTSIYFLKKGTPFEKVLSDCIIIKFSNEKKISFDGYFVKSGSVINHDIIKINPNTSISTTIRISDSYQVSASGYYTIKADESNFYFSKSKRALKNKIKNNLLQVEIINNVVKYNSKDKFIYIKTIGELNRKTDDEIKSPNDRFENGDDKQKKIILDVENKIIEFLQPLIDNGITVDKYFLKWFGCDISCEDVNSIRSNYIKILSKIKNKDIQYYFHSKNDNGDEPNDYAITTQGGKSISIYSTRFWLPKTLSGFNSQIGTLIHEYSHIACFTDDKGGNNINTCLNTACNDVYKAIVNANNYEYYIEDLKWNPTTTNQFTCTKIPSVINPNFCPPT